MKVRKQISLEDTIMEKGLKRADEVLGGNFSAYIAMLITKDCEGRNEIAITSLETEQKEEITKIDSEVSSSIDDILGK